MGKIRIQNYDENGNIESTKIFKISTFINKADELLSRHGFNLNTDIENYQELRKFSRELLKVSKLEDNTLDISKLKRTKQSKDNQEWEDERYKFIEVAFEKAKNDQDKLIELLREENFYFMDSIILLDRFPELTKKISKVKRKKYQWMVRLLKEGKSPDKDKFDPYILIGISISPKRKRKTLVYHNKKFLYSILMDIPKRLDGVKKKPVQLVKYPEWMTYDERQKWGREHRKLMKDPELLPSKFYSLYNQDVIVKGHLIITEINNKDGQA